MKEKESFSIISRIKSFEHGFRGLRDILKTEHNAWVHSAMTLFALSMSFWLRISSVEFCAIILAIISVWAAESFNTVFEILVDYLSPEVSMVAKRAKDIAAAGVLFASIGAFFIGLLILGPPLYQKISHLFSS